MSLRTSCSGRCGSCATRDGSPPRAPAGEHELRLTPAQEAALAELEALAEQAGATPPEREQVLLALGRVGEAVPLLELAIARGRVTPVAQFIMGRAALARVAADLVERYREHGPFGIGEVRDLWGVSRKYVTPILEYLDGTGFTRREGNVRHVTRPPGPREGDHDAAL